MHHPPLESQSDAVDFLAASETHGGLPVQRIDTHIGQVFIAGDRAYKLKRAVEFPYLDFSTVALRRQACERELEINRRTAPEIYLGVAPLVRREDGTLAFGQKETATEPAVVDWVVVMRAFDQDGLFDRLAREGRLTDELLIALADEIHRFHDQARAIGRDEPNRGGAAGLCVTVAENGEDLALRPDLFDPAHAAALEKRQRETIERLRPLLEDRFARGLVRHCHGDLHLRNICLLDGRPRLFDAIEFSEAMANIDVLYDLAFLLMDLDHRRLRPQANLVMNRYLSRDGALAGLAALPLFLSILAAVRAKVSAATEAGQSDPEVCARLREEARDYFLAALGYLAPTPPSLVAVGGFSGSGKSTLARRLAPSLGAAPGALHLRSDVIRKALFGVDELTRLPPKAYGSPVSVKVYREMLSRAREAITAGHAVVVDAVYDRPESRREVEALAGELGVSFTGFWLQASPALSLARAAARRKDASDATPAVVRQQMSIDPGRITWHRLDADRRPDRVATQAFGRLFQ